MLAKGHKSLYVVMQLKKLGILQTEAAPKYYSIKWLNLKYVVCMIDSLVLHYCCGYHWYCRCRQTMLELQGNFH